MSAETKTNSFTISIQRGKHTGVSVGSERQATTVNIDKPDGVIIDDEHISDKTAWSSQKIMNTKMSAAETADRLSTPRLIGLSGSADGEAYFDGTEDSYIFTSVSTISNAELEAMLI